MPTFQSPAARAGLSNRDQGGDASPTVNSGLWYRAVSESVLEADARWNTWVAQGVEHDRIARMRAVGAAVLLILGLTGWFAAALLR